MITNILTDRHFGSEFIGAFALIRVPFGCENCLSTILNRKRVRRRWLLGKRIVVTFEDAA